MVIDNGNSTWSIQNVKVNDLEYLKEEIAKVDKQLAKITTQIHQLKHEIKSDEDYAKGSNPNKTITGTEDASGVLGQELGRRVIKNAIPEEKRKLANLEKLQGKLQDKKRSYETLKLLK